MCRRFIHEDQRRLLAERSREQHQTELSAGDTAVRPVRKVLDSDAPHGALGEPLVLRSGRPESGEIGGAPNLDGLYSVFGEIVEGMDVVEAISQLPAGKNGRPNPDVKIIRAYVLEDNAPAQE
jgi:cyclophilin family peptidyl-prolyl cis-trans isomerase